ncbi:DUF4442 domain-containing protein [Sphingobacterium sp. LRF_L2]|uniref:DUF4442 domain-containing protein n=1 Tax=Sphingobacterium sp. LRF_L2 TaxID=3369421 RepID=UPI003F5E21EF
MQLSPKALKWILRFYPPFFFQRIWVKKVYPEFKQLDIEVRKSIFNKNSNGTIFGGTIFSAVDPIHTLLIDQILKKRGISKTVTWLKSAKIDYIKPASKHLLFSICIDDRDIQSILECISKTGKVEKSFAIKIIDQDGLVCAKSHNEIYIRDLTFKYPNN